LLLVSCQQGDETDSAPAFDQKIIFGDGNQDFTPVICRVGDVEITERDLDLRLAELRDAERQAYESPEGRRLLLNRMIEEVLLVEAAYERELYNDADVAQTLIANRRMAMAKAMIHTGLLKDREPTVDEIREFYLAHRDQYIKQGLMQAAHIECATEEDANAAYKRLTEGKGRQSLFPYVASEFSINEKTRATGGDLGWFNKGGFIAMVRNSKQFTEAIWDFDVGLHPPVKIGDRWHIVKVERREYARPMTLEEAEQRVKRELMPLFQERIVNEFYAGEKQKRDITFFGDYRPGDGKTDRQLFERAYHVQNPDIKRDIYELLIADYPESDLVDDSLFMLGYVATDELRDIRLAETYYRRLLAEYPDSEYAEDARYLLENLGKPGFQAPESIEDLKE
jgi:hypothetical protein